MLINIFQNLKKLKVRFDHHPSTQPSIQPSIVCFFYLSTWNFFNPCRIRQTNGRGKNVRRDKISYEELPVPMAMTNFGNFIPWHWKLAVTKKTPVTLPKYHGQLVGKVQFLGLESPANRVISDEKNWNMVTLKKLVFAYISSLISRNFENMGIFHIKITLI